MIWMYVVTRVIVIDKWCHHLRAFTAYTLRLHNGSHGYCFESIEMNIIATQLLLAAVMRYHIRRHVTHLLKNGIETDTPAIAHWSYAPVTAIIH